jgi:hypothetical protein
MGGGAAASTGGGGAAASAQPVTVDTQSPGAILDSLAHVPASGALAAYTQASQASAGVLQAQRADAQAELPKLQTPTGLPAQPRTAPERQLAPGTAAASRDPLQPASGGGANEQRLGALVAEAPAPPAPAPTRLAGGEGGDARQGQTGSDPALAHSAQGALASVQLPSGEVQTVATERPTVDMNGEADPGQLESAYAASDQQAQEARVAAAHVLQQDFGENAIYPAPDDELLEATLPQGGAAVAGTPGQTPRAGVPAEALASIDAEASPILQERIGAEQQRYAEAEAQYETDSQTAHDKAHEDIAALEDEARATQTGARDSARTEVTLARQDWQGELDQVEEDFQDKAVAARREHRDSIQAEAEAGNRKAGEHIARAEQQAEQEKSRAEAEALRKKQEAESESEGFWGWAKSAAKALIDGLKAAVNFIYDNLRKAVKALFEAAKALALAAIELARMAIVGLIKAYGAILKGLVSIALAAFPAIRDRMLRRIDEAVDKAAGLVNAAADLLKKGVAAVLDFLAETLDKLLKLIQDIYNGILTVVGMLLTGEFQELLARMGNLVAAASTAPGQFETAAYEELLGGNLDQPLSPDELMAAGRMPPAGAQGPVADAQAATEASQEEPLPGPPWNEGNLGVDAVASGEALSPELGAELLQMTGGGDGEVTFGESADPDRTIGAVLGLNGQDPASAQGQPGTGEQAAYDDGLSPRERAALKWEVMKKGLSEWWSNNWPYVLAGGVIGAAGLIIATLLTGGTIFGALVPLMTVVGQVFTGVMVAQLAGHVRDFLQKGWDGDTQGGGKSLAKGLAAGAIELISLLTFKVGSVALKGAKAGAKGVVRGAQALARGTASLGRGAMDLVRRGVGYLLKGGKVLLRGVGQGISRGVQRLRDLGARLLSRTRFKAFRIQLQGLRFRLEGRINPWVLLATGEVKWAKGKHGGLGSTTRVDEQAALVISGPARSDTALVELFQGNAQAAQDMLELMRRGDVEPRAILQGLGDLSPAEAQELLREIRRFKEVDESLLREAIDSYRARTGKAKVFGERVEGGVVAAAKTEIHPDIDRLATDPYLGASKHAGGTAPNRRYGHPGRGQDWAKHLDDHAEQTILGDVANKLDDFRADRLAREEVKGTILMAVDQDVCTACRAGLSGGSAGIIKQFSSEFPNVKVIITSMSTSGGQASKEVLVIMRGKLLIKGAG